MRIIIGLNNAKYCQQAITRFSQPSQFAPVVVTVAKYVSRPIYSNCLANRASDYQVYQTVEVEADCRCTA